VRHCVPSHFNWTLPLLPQEQHNLKTLRNYGQATAEFLLSTV